MDRQVISIARHAGSIALAFVTLAALVSATQNGSRNVPACQPAGAPVQIAELPEGSGVAASRRSPGRLWAHNDSGKPVLLALDTNGALVGRVIVSNAKVEDWEAIAVGPCPGGDCIYVGDIGDNNARRPGVTIYRIPEPANATGSAAADVFNVRFPDGAHDAEALLVSPRGEILVVTKGETGPVGVYRMPRDAKPGATVTLEPVGTLRQSVKPAERITDGAISPSGAWVALRTNGAVLFYRTEALVSGNWQEAARVSLKSLGEPQGEGITFGDDKTIFLVGEGGGKSRPGTLGRLTCAF